MNNPQTYLLPMEEAFRRFLPDEKHIAARTMIYSEIDEFKAGVVEGDLAITAEGLILTSKLVPAFENVNLGALFITGSLLAPNATVSEPDMDRSPLLKVKGDVVAKNLCLAGSFSEIDGDVTIAGILHGFYNHGQMRIGGTTRAELILTVDYEFIFEGPVKRKYVASWDGRLNIPVDYDRDRLELILVPEVINEKNYVHDNIIVDRLKRGLPILRPEGRIGKPPPKRLSDKGAARLAQLHARSERGKEIGVVDFTECELRYVPEALREFPRMRELSLTENRVKVLPGWIGDFTGLEVLELAGCGLATLPQEIAQLPRLHRLDLYENPITSLPFGPNSFRSVEVLRIGDGYSDEPAAFTADLDTSLFPRLRVLQQCYKYGTEITYRKTQKLWSNPNLEVLDIDAKLKPGFPSGLLQARNLRALALQITPRQIGALLRQGPAFERLEYLSLGYCDISRAQFARLHEALPRVFISSKKVDGKDDYDFPESERLQNEVQENLWQKRFPEAIAAADDIISSLDLALPMLPIDLHAKLMMLAVKCRRAACEEEKDRSHREAKAENAIEWSDRVLAVLPKSLEACWYLGFGYGTLWSARLECLYARAIGLALRATPDMAAAHAILDTAQGELDRFMRIRHRGGHEYAEIRRLRARISQ